MKITAKQIEPGQVIKLAKIIDRKERLENKIKGLIPYFSREDIEIAKFLLSENITSFIQVGSIVKNSPILKVNDVKFCDSSSYTGNGRRVTFNNIILYTDQGNFTITTRQKVQLIS